MKLRTIAYTAVLALTGLTLTAGSASAQTARGLFTLPHEVRWQNASVPAGEYEFSLDAKGPSQLMMLRQRDGGHVGFMLLVSNTGPALTGDTDRLVLINRDGKSFVQRMTLPYFGLTLHFTVPSEGADKEVALAGDHPDPTRNR